MTETDRIENMNRPNINADIKIVIKKKIFQQTKFQGQMVSQVNFTKRLEKS